MAGDNIVTYVGNLVNDLEQPKAISRSGPNNEASARLVVNGRIAYTPRKFDRQTNSWVDDTDKTLFAGFSVWGDEAQNVYASLGPGRGKGTRVLVIGRLVGDTYDEKDAQGNLTGRKVTGIVIEDAELFVSTKFGVVAFQKQSRAQAPVAAPQMAQAAPVAQPQMNQPQMVQAQPLPQPQQDLQFNQPQQMQQQAQPQPQQQQVQPQQMQAQPVQPQAQPQAQQMQQQAQPQAQQQPQQVQMPAGIVPKF